MIAPDDTTFEYLAGRPYAPSGKEWDEAVELAVEDGLLTADIAYDASVVDTTAAADAVLDRLEACAGESAGGSHKPVEA